MGRDAQMTALRLASGRADQGSATGIVLVGEPGVGKTRLATELAQELVRDGALQVMSHGVQLSGGELPYGGITELVRGLVRTVGAAELARAAGRELQALGALDSAFGPQQGPDRAAVTSALIAAIEGMARRRTVVWIVDDLQWLDEVSRDLVVYLVRVVEQARLLVIATVREAPSTAATEADPMLELVRAPGVTSLHVGPLSPEAIDQQARSLSTKPLGPEELERIHRLSDGLPFFVEELVAADGAIPSTLHKAVTMSTRNLADETRLVLRSAALEETLSRPDLLAHVTGLSEAQLVAPLAEARKFDILRRDSDTDLLRFRHALLRDAVDDEMLASERRALHRRWAEALDEAARQPDAPPSLIVARARHWHLAGDPQAAFPHVLAAARYVDATEDQPAQALWWARVLETWPRTGDVDVLRDSALSKAVIAWMATDEDDRTLSFLERERALAEPDALRALWLLLLHRHVARFARQADDLPGPLPSDSDALFAWLVALPPDFRVSQALHFLLHEWDTVRPDLYLPICDELARRGEAEDEPDNWYLAMRHRGWWQQSLGDFEGSVETTRQARAVVLAKAPARRMEAEWDWCWSLEECGRYEQAMTASERALAPIPDPRAMPYLWGIVARCIVSATFELGRWTETRLWSERTRAEARAELQDRMIFALDGRLDGQLAVRGGELAEAERQFSRLTSDGGPGRPAANHRTVVTACLVAEIALATGEASRVDQALADLERIPHFLGGPDHIAHAVLALARLPHTCADRLLERVQAVSERLLPPAGPIPTAVRTELSEQLRRSTESDSAGGWAAVAETWQGLSRPYDVAWCRHLQATAAARDGDRDTAARALAEACRVAGELGAQPLRDRIEATARRHRLPLEGRATRTVAELTERETEVLRLVAAGRTNAQIAEELVMSPKTASVHVSRILSKLGAANRTEAAAAASRLGLD